MLYMYSTAIIYWLWIWLACRGLWFACGWKNIKDIGMGVRKGPTMVSFIPTLFGCFLGIPSLYVSSFF